MMSQAWFWPRYNKQVVVWRLHIKNLNFENDAGILIYMIFFSIETTLIFYKENKNIIFIS